MNCRRCEKLIPLYVEGDLASGLADQIAAHLDWCGKCNWIFDEYKASQIWLRSPGAPEFDDEELNVLKVGILRRVGEAGGKPSWLSALTQQWNRKQLFALSTAVLVIVGFLLLYVYQSRAKVTGGMPQVAGSQSADQPKQVDHLATDHLAADKEMPSANGMKKKQRQPNRRHVATGRYQPVLAQRTVDQNGSDGRSGDAIITVDSSASAAASPALLRIEIQTTDPNIRIIWFAPKERDPHQTKPATD